jgi:lipopolysaccharide/colanic/teichoic acid biosynthesis glycosyltransferase
MSARPIEQKVASRAARPRRTRTAARAKRALDVCGALILLVLLSWLFGLIALAIRLDSRGPALFRQRRIGRDGRPFELVKFRTMVENAEAMVDSLRERSRDPNWLLLDDDPRVTRVGRILRRTSLDELPEFWHVLRGQMSLVGPRPLSEQDQRNVPSWGGSRSEVPPGLTGLWQVTGRTTISFEDMVRLDCLYVKNWTLRRDLMLLVRTVPALLTARGAN